jgi:hypothetical protein
MTSPCFPVPPVSTPMRELAVAIAGALTLPDQVTTLSEENYLRISRDHARLVLFTMRRITAAPGLNDADLMAVVASLRERTGQLAIGREDPADPFRDFIEAVIAVLTITPGGATSELAYLQDARQRARRVLRACRHVAQEPFIDDHNLVAAAALLRPDSNDQHDDSDDDQDDSAATAPEAVR